MREYNKKNWAVFKVSYEVENKYLAEPLNILAKI